MRAFLSHSSLDKALVSSVAKELGRQYCVFDQYEFKTGDDFRHAIREGLDASVAFVLFASKESLTRDWVNFELDEAEHRKIRGSIKKVLVFIIDDHTKFDDIPEWLRRGKIKKLSSPKAIAREITYHLYELIRDQQHPVFVGRTKEIEEIERALNPVDGSRPPRIFLLYGLPGIGRRTLCRRTGNDILRLPKSVVIPIESGDELGEVALKTMEEVAPFKTSQQLKDSVADSKNESPERLTSIIVENFRALTNNGDIPVIFDQGGLLDNDGNLIPVFSSLLSEIDAAGDIYLAVVTSRRPKLEADTRLPRIPRIRISELNSEEVKRLLARIASDRNIQLDSKQISELAEYVRGYPPATFYALELVKRYGIDLILSDKQQLVEFRTTYFVSILSKDKELTPKRKDILRVLSYYGALPPQVLGKALDLDADELFKCLNYLYDCVFVLPEDDGRCRLAEPLVDSIHRIVGGIEDIDHGKLASAIEDYLRDLEAEDKRLDMSRALFRSLTLCGGDSSEMAIQLASDLIRVTEDFYHQQDYERAIKYGLMAVEQRPNNIGVRSYYIRALIKFEKYDAATKEIEEIRRRGAFKDACFLTGFMARRRDQLIEAIVAYEEAIKRGRKGLAVHREIADCYFRSNNLSKAREHIDIAQTIEPDNRFVIDLQIQIATNQRDERTAREKLDILKIVDTKAFYHHRLSTVEYAFGRINEAYNSALGAFNKAHHPTLAILSQLIKCEIETNRINDAATHINLLEKRFPHIKHDIKIGLRCKWEISQRKFDNALVLWDKLKEKDKPVHKALRRDALAGLIASIAHDDSRAAALKLEVSRLNIELQSIDPRNLVFEIEDPR